MSGDWGFISCYGYFYYYFTITEIWMAPEYTVAFDKQGGMGTANDITVTCGQPYGTLPTLTKSGYTFEGWWTAPNGGGTQITSSTIVSITQNQTLYARWMESGWTRAWSGNINLILEGINWTDEGVEYFDIPGVSGLSSGKVRVIGYWNEYFSNAFYREYIPFDVTGDANDTDLLIGIKAEMDNMGYLYNDFFTLRISGDSQLAGEWGFISCYGYFYYYFTITEIWVMP